ncbi:GNAT family N-acetyltransferase [Deinococcus sonorensis]|uniref:GNAT family N-acetyltransferase n=2 Tax=Deinococcus sonorensis TaxID=309891 RepID=A0AAU7U9Q6_9DEIO
MPEVIDNPEQKRYELRDGARLLGFAEYRPVTGALLFPHTEIEEGHEGQGLASLLIRTALDDARARSLNVIPMCPFVAGFIRRHPEYLSLVQPAQRTMFKL